MCVEMSGSSGQTYERVSHCIFDFDGTLINSESFLTQAINEVLQRYGKCYDWSVKSKTTGLHMGLSGPIIIEELDLPLTLQEFTDSVLKEFERSLCNGSVEFMSGAERLVQHLSRNGVHLAICTASTQLTFKYKIKHFGHFFDVGKHFHHIVIAGDDPNVRRNKPHADPYLYCIEQFDPPPQPRQVLVFEDSPTGLQSALSAGCQVVLIPDPKYDKNKFVGESTLVIDSLNDFDPQVFGLPKF